MNTNGTLLLTGKDVAALLTIDECMAAVEHAFKLHGKGETQPPGILGVHARDGGFHIKAGMLELNRAYFAAKINANFPDNPARLSLPTIQGVVVLCDAENGYPLAVMDSIEITVLRTGAATGVAAKYLARPDSKTVTICGCGNQGRISLRALSEVLSIQKVWAFDRDQQQIEDFVREFNEFDVAPVSDLATAIGSSDVCVTCTPAKQPFVKSDFVAPGTFIAAVGSDNPEKQELEVNLLANSKLVADVLEQCATIGELHHALEANLITTADVYGELGEIVAGTKPGRTSADEIIIFDSTGMALQDVVAAAAVYEKALREGVGVSLDLAPANR